MTPTASAVHVNRPLTNMSIAYLQDPRGFVADQVFPNIPVEKQSDVYFAYDRSDFWRNTFQKRGPGTESAGGGWKIANTPYYAHVWALHKDIDDQIRANQDSPLNLDRDATIYLSEQAQIAREVTWAAAYFTTGIWSGWTGAAVDITGVAASPGVNDALQWNDANATPIPEITTKMDAQHLLTGRRPNTLVLGRQVWSKLKDHATILDRIKYSSSAGSPAIVTRQAVAALFEIERILVMDGIQVTSAENPAFETSMTTAFIGGKNALLTYVPPNPGIMTPASGYTFSWRGYLGASGANGVVVSKFRMEWLKSDRVEAEMAYTQLQTGAMLGTFYSGIVA